MANWSLILNVLLLIGVVFALLSMLRNKNKEKQRRRMYRVEPTPADIEADDIIAVRKLNTEAVEPVPAPLANQPPKEALPKEEPLEEAPSLMMFLLAKDNRQLGGYDLLQTLLAAGLRFGDGQLFHRHQMTNGQGPIICSLAAATDAGTFDLQNMGTFSARGLCLFMAASGNASIDAERLHIMLDTAKQLSDSLDTYLLDDTRAPWSDSSLLRYQKLLGITADETVVA